MEAKSLKQTQNENTNKGSSQPPDKLKLIVCKTDEQRNETRRWGECNGENDEQSFPFFPQLMRGRGEGEVKEITADTHEEREEEEHKETREQKHKRCSEKETR